MTTLFEGSALAPDTQALNQRPQPSDPVLSRRDAFLAAGAALTGLAARSHARPPQVTTLAEPPPYRDPSGQTIVAKLVSRVCFAPTLADYQQAESMGFAAYLEWQLNPSAIDDSAMTTRLQSLPLLGLTAPQIYAQIQSEADYDAKVDACALQLETATLLRAAFSRRQLFERMVEFWSDHFSIHLDDRDRKLYKLVDDRAVIRQNALGNFSTMLRASASSPAMLDYLDNAESSADGINENYARELMELHTVTPASGYQHDDIVDVARCFTGWTINYFERTDASTHAQAGTFRFDGSAHDTGPKTVLGHAIPPRPPIAGQQDGIDVLNILASRPTTASFIASKLCRRFLGDGTPAATVSAVAAAFTASSGDIKTTLRAVLTPANIAAAKPRVRRPMHHWAAALRVTGAVVTDEGVKKLLRDLQNAGHRPFSWAPPNGFPDADAYWSNQLLQRWNFAAKLAAGSYGTDVAINVAQFYAGASTPQQRIDVINKTLFNGLLLPQDAAILLQYMQTSPNSQYKWAETLGLALSSPAFVWI